MRRNYSLRTKIEALDTIDEGDGNAARVSELLGIPERTLRYWLEKEDDLRRRYREGLKLRRSRLSLGLQVEMLEQGEFILARIRKEEHSPAALSQLTAALGNMVSKAQKLEGRIEETDEREEQSIRFEYYYDDQVQEAPPWAEESDAEPEALQGGGLRPALGQDGAGQNADSAQGFVDGPSLLVADADETDERTSLARLEEQHQALEGGADQ